uniref:LOB domain-containing protein 1 n=1 Tax=Anthurium amnicola TaxID=1678845 RepID=A0A1D1XNT8_9ARAE
MEGSGTTTITNKATRSPSTSSSPTSSSPLPPPVVVLSPCAACKVLRRRCVDKCLLAPYFPPTDPVKFTIAHRVFGASNIIKFLQELPESQRADAVSSMVYEANARIRDPVYGCAGAIFQLHEQVTELQAQLATAQAEHTSMKAQHSNLVAFLCMDMGQSQQQLPPNSTFDVLDDVGHPHLLLQNDACPKLGDVEQLGGSMWDDFWE